MNTQNKIKIAIHGSCCSREIFNSSLNNFELGAYLFQNPIHTMFEKPFPLEIKEEDILNNSNFMRRMVASEFNKKALQTLANNPADYLMIDVGDLRLGRFNLSFNSGEKIKIFKTDDTQKELQHLKDKLKNFDFNFNSSSEIADTEWDYLIDKYTAEIKKIYPLDKIIFNQIAIASQYEKDGKLIDFTAEIGGDIFKNQGLLLKLQSKLEEKLKGCLVLDNPPFPIIADSNHKLGLHLLHLKQEVYDYKMRKLQEILMKNKIITVKNAEGDSDTQAEIVIQNKIDYKPKVSVIIPVYNTEEYLRECLDSVINQTLKEIEIICIDDGSTDNSLEILKEYAQKDSRLKVLKQKNKGCGIARNKGIRTSNGTFVCFMDSDDKYPEIDTLEIMYLKAKENNVLICGGEFAFFTNNNPYLSQKYSQYEDGYGYESSGIMKYIDYQFDYGYHRFIYNREFLLKNHIYYPKYKRFQDPPFFIKAMFEAEQFYALKKVTYAFRCAHKTVNWNTEKTNHMLLGILDNMQFAKSNNLERLNDYSFIRLQQHLPSVKDAFNYKSLIILNKMKKYNKNVIKLAEDNKLSFYRLYIKPCAQSIFSAQNSEDKKHKIITVKNAEGDSDTQAEIVIQNKIDYKPKVSVIIPVYNTEEYLRECLDSVINQTLKEIEIICVDDGSTDSSLEILKEYARKDNRITIMRQKKLYAGVARNAGLDIATGSFLSFLDADDFFEPDMLEIALNKIEKTRADFVIYNSNRFDDKTKQFTNPDWQVKYNSFPNKKHFNYQKISGNIFKSVIGWAWDKLYRTDFVKKHNLRFQEQRTANDALFVFSALFLAEKISLLDKEKRLAHHRINNCSSLENTRSKSWMCFYNMLIALKERIIKENKFDELEHDFVNYALHFSLWNFNTLPEPVSSLLKEKLQNEWFHSLGISSKKNNYFENEREYLQLLAILKNQPKVSVIMPCYNTAPYLRQALDSVINQTLKEIEIICVNDGSTDNTLDIIKEYAAKDKRIVVIDGPNGGYGKAMNIGLNNATGEYIGIVEPDDYIEPNMYETLYNKAVENNVDFVKGDLYYWWSIDNKRKYTNCISDKSLYNSIQKNFFNINLSAPTIANWAGIYKKEFIDQHNIRHLETPGASYQDQGFYYKIIFNAKSAYYVNHAFYHYRQDNMSSSVNNKNKIYCIFDEYNEIERILEQKENKEKFYKLVFCKKYNSCRWNYGRINEKFKPLFYKRLCKEFANAYYTGRVIRDNFNREQWENIRSWVRDYEKTIKKPEITCFNKIPIILAADNNYAPQMYIAILSILENKNYSTFYDFYLMVSSEFSNKNTELLLSLKSKYNCNINFIDMKDAFSDLTMKISHITSPTYYRLLAANLLPQQYDKCIYLDVDICACSDLSELYNIDIEDYYVAGVIAAGYARNKNNCTRLSIPSVDKYLNAGILLMNLKKIRKDNLTQTFLELSRNNYASQDQDVINVACYNKVKVLPFKYNFMTKYKNEIEGKDKEFYSLYDDNSIDDALKEPYIIHFADKIKPWNDCNCYMADYWWCYAKLSPYNFKKNETLLKNIFSIRNNPTTQQDKYPIDVQKKYQEEIDILFNKYVSNNTHNNNSPLLFKDIGLGCNTWCSPISINENNGIKKYTYDLTDNIYTRYVSWDPIKEGSCDVEIIKLSAVEKRSKKVVAFPITKIVSNGKIIGNKVEFRNQRGCWIGCTIEGAYENFTVEAKIKNI